MAHKRSFANVFVHLVWATRYRTPILQEPHDVWLSRVIRRKCFESGCQALAVGMAPDHVHAAIRLNATMPISDVARRLKGASSRLWNLTQTPHLSWQDGYWAESIRPQDLGRLCAYIDNQRQHHHGRDVSERWMHDLGWDKAAPAAGFPRSCREL